MLEPNLKGKTAIITGAGQGIGREISFALARCGCNVVLASRTEAQLEAVAKRIREEREGSRVIWVKTDITLEEDVKTLVRKTLSVFGKVDILVNNAGTGIALPITETRIEDWDRMMNTNARGAFLCSREVFKEMVRLHIPGMIVNIASLAGKKGYLYQSAYCASKFALIGFSKVLAMEGKQFGIRVHCVCPGGVNTDFIKNMRPDIEPETLIQPQDIAETVVFLVSRRPEIVIDEVLIRRFAAEVM